MKGKLEKSVLFVLPLSLLLLNLASCGEGTVYQERQQMETASAWLYQDSLLFNVPIRDTGRYDFILEVEHGKTYPFQNLYTKVLSQAPEDSLQEKVISLELAQKTGVWNGKCRGSSCRLRIMLEEGEKMEQTGNYRFTFLQHTRQDTLPEVYALRLVVK